MENVEECQFVPKIETTDQFLTLSLSRGIGISEYDRGRKSPGNIGRPSFQVTSTAGSLRFSRGERVSRRGAHVRDDGGDVQSEVDDVPRQRRYRTPSLRASSRLGSVASTVDAFHVGSLGPTTSIGRSPARAPHCVVDVRMRLARVESSRRPVLRTIRSATDTGRP